jgi:protein-S-isoprenylcysteine O-methyltransferase Ste14
MKTLTSRVLSRVAALPVFIYLCFILPAGTWNFWEVYVYFGVVVVLMLIALVYFLRTDPELLERRMKTKESEDEQKAIVAVLAICVLAMFLIPGFDKRNSWSEVSTTLVLLGDGLTVAGYLGIMRVFKENSYASRVVEIEQGQSLIDTGPYSFVRHPMYLAVILMYLGTPVALGSWWAYIPMALIPVLIAFRVLSEEDVLKNGLEGYVDYCQRVRWRILPGIW